MKRVLCDAAAVTAGRRSRNPSLSSLSSTHSTPPRMPIGAHPMLRHVEQRIEAAVGSLPPEPQEGNTEYKLKLLSPTAERFQHLVTQMKWRLAEGAGEAIYQIGVADDGTALGLCGEDLDASLNTLAEMAEAVGAHITLLRRRPSLDEQGMLAEVHVRRVPDDRQFLDVRAVVLGASGAGKSTLISVLASGQLDSGAGSARLNLFRHNHEIVTGRTSALSTEVLGFDADGRLLNNADADDAQAVAGGEAAAAEEVYTRASKLVHLADSPGHAKYRRTTMTALANPDVDYALLVVAANAGLSESGKELLEMAAALSVPTAIVVTKMDVCPRPVLRETLKQVMAAVKAPPCKKVPLLVKGTDDVVIAHDLTQNETIPIFIVSSVTGHKLDLLKTFLNLLPADRQSRSEALSHKPTKCRIQETFNIAGVGPVVAAHVDKGLVRTGDVLSLGPDEAGNYIDVRVKDIHRCRRPARLVKAGQLASFALDTTAPLRRGQVLVAPDARPKACHTFTASVLVLKATTPVAVDREVSVFVDGVRQTARLARLSCNEIPATGSATVDFVFLARPEVVAVGVRVVFADAHCRGIGVVTATTSASPRIEPHDAL